jgi:hypothetical protein
VFHINVAYVAMVCTLMLQAYVPMLNVFFRRMLQVLSGCCICFTHILQVFYLDVAYVFAMVFKCFHVFVQVLLCIQVSSVSFICCKYCI